MKEGIQAELFRLAGLKLQFAGRASSLFWLGFGDLISISRKGMTETAAEYALHIQCSWRVSEETRILLASRDMYVPHSEWEGDIEEFDPEVLGSSRFDERMELFLKKDLFAKEIEADGLGGFTIVFSNGYRLETFPDSSEDDDYSEYWRFFSRKVKTPHVVVSAKGIEKV